MKKLFKKIYVSIFKKSYSYIQGKQVSRTELIRETKALDWLLIYYKKFSILPMNIQDGKCNLLLYESFKASLKQIICKHKFIQMDFDTKTCHKCLETRTYE
ncbi:MAG: hypothetical protein WC707_06810 [Candidatus Babeliaceae bacterium]|jgi:hypothetical protein